MVASAGTSARPAATGPLDVLLQRATSKEVADEQAERAFQLLSSIIAATPPVRAALKEDLEKSLYEGDESTRFDAIEKLIETIEDCEKARMGKEEPQLDASGVSMSLFQAGASGPLNEAFLRNQLECEVKARQVAQEWCQSLEAEIGKLRWRLDAELRLRGGLEAAKERLTAEAEAARTGALEGRDREAEAAGALRAELHETQRRLREAQSELEATASLKTHLERHYASMRATAEAESEAGGKMREHLEALREQAAALLAERAALRADVERLSSELESSRAAGGGDGGGGAAGAAELGGVRTIAQLRVDAEAAAQAAEARHAAVATRADRLVRPAPPRPAPLSPAERAGVGQLRQRGAAVQRWGETQRAFALHCTAAFSFRAWRDVVRRKLRIEGRVAEMNARRARRGLAAALAALRLWAPAGPTAAASAPSSPARSAAASSLRELAAVRAAFDEWREGARAAARHARLTARLRRVAREKCAPGRSRDAGGAAGVAGGTRAWRLRHDGELAARVAEVRDEVEALRRAELAAVAEQAAAAQARPPPLPSPLASSAPARAGRGRGGAGAGGGAVPEAGAGVPCVAGGGAGGRLVRALLRLARRLEPARVQALVAELQAAPPRPARPGRLTGGAGEQVQVTGKDLEELYEAEFAGEPRLAACRAAQRRATFREELRAAMEERLRERRALEAAEAEREQLHAVLAEAVKARAAEAEKQRRHLEGVEAQFTALRKQVVAGAAVGVPPHGVISPGRPSSAAVSGASTPLLASPPRPVFHRQVAALRGGG
eukprot:tig00000478_g1280.t1